MCFIRINPSTAPLTPPGAAPTLTTIYDEHGHIPSEFVSPTNSLSKESTTDPSIAKSKSKSKRKHRLNLVDKPAPASVAAVQGTESERKRTQGIADSLDLGMELTPDGESGKVMDVDVERRRGTVAGYGEPARVVRKGDGRLEFRDGRRASVGRGVNRGSRRASVG